MFKNILIYNPFGIGDVLFSTPLIKALAENFPSAKIYYIVNQRGCYIVKNNPYLTEVIIFEKDYYRNISRESKIRFLKEFLAFLKKIKSFKTDLMIDLSLNYHASLIGRLLAIPRRVGFNYRNRGRFLTAKIDLEGFKSKHVILYYMDLLKLLDISMPENIFIQTFTSREDDEWADNFIRENNLTGKFIMGVIPGGGRSWGKDARYRRWPVSNFAHVADRLVDEFDASIILFGDKDEKSLCDETQSLMQDKVINASGKTSVGEFMSLVKCCNILLCNEGGPLHIAVALGVPTVSIFGPVDEKIYGPFNKDISRHIVISDRSKCKPCYYNFRHKECDTLICLESISEEKVLSAIKALIGRSANKERKLC